MTSFPPNENVLIKSVNTIYIYLIRRSTMTDEGIELILTVMEAKELIGPANADKFDTFVRIYMVPDETGALQTKVKQRQIENTDRKFGIEFYKFASLFWFSAIQKLNVSELQRNIFVLAEQKADKAIVVVSLVSQWECSHINRYVLSFICFSLIHFTFHSKWIWERQIFTFSVCIGEAEFHVGDVRRPITTWLSLSDSRHNKSVWGELMFSLSYLPTAERLTVVVVKARNLKMSETQQVSLHNVFVKVSCNTLETKIRFQVTAAEFSMNLSLFCYFSFCRHPSSDRCICWKTTKRFQRKKRALDDRIAVPFLMNRWYSVCRPTCWTRYRYDWRWWMRPARRIRLKIKRWVDASATLWSQSDMLLSAVAHRAKVYGIGIKCCHRCEGQWPCGMPYDRRIRAKQELWMHNR